MEKCGVVSVCNWLVKSAVQICVAHVRECCTAMWDGGQFTWQFWSMTGKRTYSWLHFNRSSHLSRTWSAQLFTKVEANNCFSIYHTKTKKITIKLFLSTYQKKWLETKLLTSDFVSMAAQRWKVLANHFLISQSGHTRSTIHLCGID